jgi:uncharacterized protein with PIN domain
MKNKICKKCGSKLKTIIKEEVIKWDEELDFRYYQDYYCPKCELKVKNNL